MPAFREIKYRPIKPEDRMTRKDAVEALVFISTLIVIVVAIIIIFPN